MELLSSSRSLCWISSEKSVQSAFTETTPFCSTTFFTRGVLSAQRKLTWQVAHQSAVKVEHDRLSLLLQVGQRLLVVRFPFVQFSRTGPR